MSSIQWLIKVEEKMRGKGLGLRIALGDKF